MTAATPFVAAGICCSVFLIWVFMRLRKYGKKLVYERQKELAQKVINSIAEGALKQARAYPIPYGKFALCLQCGHVKSAVLPACEKCTFQPNTDRDRARAWIYSAYGMTKEGLHKYLETHEGRALPEPPENLVQKWITYIRQHGENDGWVDLSTLIGRKPTQEPEPKPTDAAVTSPSAPGSGRPKTLLEEASERIDAHFVASGIPRVDAPPRPAGEYTATFVPRRQQSADIEDTKRPFSRKAVELMSYIATNNFACPPYDRWMEMYVMIPANGHEHKVSPPVAKHLWPFWPVPERHARLMLHIASADTCSPEVIDRIDHYLRQIEPDLWIKGWLKQTPSANRQS